MIHKHNPVIVKEYTDSKNVSTIFGACLRVIQRKHGYELGSNEKDHELLINLVDYVHLRFLKENPTATLKQLNEHTCRMYVDMIEKILHKGQAQQRQQMAAAGFEEQLTQPQAPPNPQLSQAPTEQEFNDRMMLMNKSRGTADIPVIPRPQVSANRQNLNDAYEHEMELRKIQTKTPQANFQVKDNIPERSIEQQLRDRDISIPNFPKPAEEVDINQIYSQHLHQQPPNNTVDETHMQHFYEPTFTHPQPINSVTERIKGIQESQHESQLRDDIVTDNAAVLQTYPEPLQKQRDEHENRLMEDHILVIDSRDRNYDDHPSPNSYRFSFDHPYDNIVSISLLSAEVPKSQYNVNSSNNKIYFQETNAQVSGGTFLEATIPVGDYTLATLKTALESAMNGVGTATYTLDITTNAAQSKVALSSTLGGVDLFNLLFNGGTENFGNKTRSVYRDSSIGPVLGFNRTDKTESGSYTGDARVNLNGDAYVLMKFTDFPYMDAGINSDGAQNAFAKIPLDTHTDNVKYHKEGDYEIVRTLEQLHTRLDHLDISFVNYDGSLYDFNGLEHSITLKITTLRYNNNS